MVLLDTINHEIFVVERWGFYVTGFNCCFLRVQTDSPREIHIARDDITDIALYRACLCTDNQSADLW